MYEHICPNLFYNGHTTDLTGYGGKNQGMIVGPARAANLEIIARVLYLYLKQYPVIWK